MCFKGLGQTIKAVYRLECFVFFFSFCMACQLNWKAVIGWMFISLVGGCFWRTLDCLPLSHVHSAVGFLELADWPWSASRSWWIIVITVMLMCSEHDLTLTILTDIWIKTCPDKVLYNEWPQILWFKRNTLSFSLRAAVQKSEQAWVGSVLKVSQGWNRGFMRDYI